MKAKYNMAAAFLASLLLTACSETSIDQTQTETAPAYVSEETAIEETVTEEHVAEETAVEVQAEENTSVSVNFSHDGGFYETGFDLTLSSDENGEIYYTTDGSDPTTSETAVLYSAPVAVKDRSGDKNVVSAVDPLLFSGNFNEVNEDRNNFTCKIAQPSDEQVDKCTIVRAVLKKGDGSYGKEAFSAYYIGNPEEHITGLADSCAASGQSLAVINIAMNYEDLFDGKKGIYVKGNIFDKALEEYLLSNRLREGEDARSLDANYKQRGREWERTAAILMYEVTPDGSVTAIDQKCGVRIQGNYSRSDLQKGFRLYARKDYGEKSFNYPVFGEEYLRDSGEVMDEFKTLNLRAGGNCAFTAKFNDAYWQSLITETACATKRSRPCVVYLNGEYWGLYVLEEDYTDDHMEYRHGVKKEDVVIYKGDAEKYKRGYAIDEGEIPVGEKESYYFQELFDFFRSHDDLRSEEDYNEFIKIVDPQSVMDYFAVQCWVNNKWDWPGKNWSMWKTINTDDGNEYADGRWRFMFYDLDFGGVSGGGDAGTNTIKEDNYKPFGLLDMDTNNPAVLSFAYLMTNEGFRNDFYERIKGLSDGYFENGAAQGRLSEFIAVYYPLYEQFFERYEGTGTPDDAIEGDYATALSISSFIDNRPDNIQKMIDYCEKVLN